MLYCLCFRRNHYNNNKHCSFSWIVKYYSDKIILKLNDDVVCEIDVGTYRYKTPFIYTVYGIPTYYNIYVYCVYYVLFVYLPV